MTPALPDWLVDAGHTVGTVVHRIVALAVRRQPEPPLNVMLGLGLAALVLVALRVTWRPVRMIGTVLHEAGHALAAVLTGRRLSGIRLHSDTSGLTLSKGRTSGAGMVLTLAAGYPAPSLAAVAAAAGVGAGYAAAVLWIAVAGCVIMLVSVRNLFGLLVVVVLGGGIAAVSWLAPPVVLSWVAVLGVWAMLLAAPRPLVELARQRDRRGSDVAQLARLTRLPWWLWLTLFTLITVAGLVAGGWLLLR